MRRLTAIVLSLSLPALAACTSSEDMTLLHREITDVQQQVEQLSQSMPAKQDLTSLDSRMQEVAAQTSRSNADLAMRVEQLQEQIEALQASLERTTRQLETISQELARARSSAAAGQYLPPVTAAAAPAEGAGGATAGPAAPAGAAAAAAAGAAAEGAAAGSTEESSPEELYRAAYEDYMRGNYELAADGFGEYRRRWPSTELSDNALYWIGECLDAQDKTEEALAIFTQVLEEYPASDKAPAAQLKKGLLYLKLGDKGQGALNLQYVVYEYPGTREADLARERLRSLGMTIR